MKITKQWGEFFSIHLQLSQFPLLGFAQSLNFLLLGLLKIQNKDKKDFYATQEQQLVKLKNV